MDTQAAWWLRHPKSGNVVLVVHEETRDRCLSEGWTPTTDPRLVALADADAPAGPPAPVTDTASSVPVPPVPPVPAGDLSDLTAVGDSPEALAGALEAADVARVTERNTAARTAFGIQTPPAAQHQTPAPTVRGRRQGGR